jgi:hypothetical protein
MHFFGFIIRIYHDARPSECQVHKKHLVLVPRVRQTRKKEQRFQPRICSEKRSVQYITDKHCVIKINLILFDLQLGSQNSYLFIYNTLIKILYMFLALPCSSSGGLRRNCIPPEDEQGNARNVENFNKYIIYKQIRNLCIKLEINQGYTTKHGQPIIKIKKNAFNNQC